jgi:DNA/RNA endonuclease G (NUC1)
MKKLLLVFIAVAIVSAAFFYVGGTRAQTEKPTVESSLEVSPHLVISQFQAGRATPNFNDEFVEIHNTSSNPVDLNGYRLVYRSQNGQNDVANPFVVWTTSTIIPAGGFYLVAATSYDGPVTPNTTYDPTGCSCSMSGTNGGLAIRQGPNNTGAIIDSVAWGTVTNGFNEGTATTAHPIDANDNSKVRLQNGCQDTDNNANDFATQIPSTPRNASSAPVTCSGSGTNLFAAINANPTTVTPPQTTLLTVTVIPATTPPSTNITVVGNLTDIGGPNNQPFFDDGTNGDTTAGDNVFSYLATVPAGTTGGIHVVTAVASDAQGRNVPLTQNITVNGPLPDDDPLIFGNPSNATGDIANENNYLMQKPQYSLSYNRSKATPNWTAWRLDSTWIGTANNGDFDIDNSLPAGWYRVTPDDYNEPVYDRGHMCPAGDRTRTQPDNTATYLMTNIIPQLPANNQGPWVDLENYCRTLASQGNEVYVISGPHGNIGTIGSTQQNRVVVPNVTWKVVLVLPNGNNDLQRASARTTRVFGVIMSNTSISQSAPWRNFRVTVNEVEWLTGYDFFSMIPKNTQEIIERRRDRL